ncbi:MAG: hypothetical protein GC161_12010 [Planctomycetaceae bacterium]|nr:hypothetical protein [Planctomycetaceae bacterium]
MNQTAPSSVGRLGLAAVCSAASLALVATAPPSGAQTFGGTQFPGPQIVSPTVRTTLFGSVEYPNGVPAAGVSVQLSSGQTLVTDAAGKFQGLITVPQTSGTVQLVVDQALAGVPYSAAGQSGQVMADGFTRGGRLMLSADAPIQPEYVATFGSVGGGNGSVFGFGQFDFGSGPELVAAGGFTSMTGVACNRVTRFDGETVRAIGAGLPAIVRSVASFDAGNGPELFAGGDFFWSPGSPLASVARFNGQTWEPAFDLAQYQVNGTVRAMVVADLGDGARLYAGGGLSFLGQPVRLAAFDGTTWTPVGGGIAGPGNGVHALELFDGDGDGELELYVGGQFTVAGGVPVANLARWDGQSWNSVGTGANATVRALEVADPGIGPRLFVGGEFTAIDGVPVNRVASYDGTSFVGLGSGLNSDVNALEWIDLGGAGPVQGEALVAGGLFEAVGPEPFKRLAAFDGQSWKALTPPFDGPVYTLAAVPGRPGTLAIGGAFQTIGGQVSAGGLVSPNLCLYTSGDVESAGDLGLAAGASAVLEHDFGDGTALYFGGEFLAAGSAAATRVTRFDGESYTALGDGFSGKVRCLAVFDSGFGPELVAGGEFIESGTQNVRRTARFDGSAWQPLVFANKPVTTMLPVSDATGTRLYLGGEFTNVDGVPAPGVAVLENGQVSPVGLGVNGLVSALCMFQAPGDPEPYLYVGGAIGATGAVPAAGLVRLQGGTLVGLGLAAPSTCAALQVFDDGSGPALYVGGTLRLTPPVSGSGPTYGVLRFDGTSFTPLPFLTSGVNALTAHDDGAGRGPELYVGGSFSVGAGQFLNGIARWDGQSYQPLLAAETSTPTIVAALASVRLSGTGPRSLVLAGSFASSPGGDSHAARFGPVDF